MFPVLAQRFANGADQGALVLVLVLVCAALLVGLLIAIFFLLTLQRALARCRPRNRTMEPGMVWLNLIPLFNLVWQFITVNRVAESLENEFRDRGWHRRSENYGRSVGVAAGALGLVGWIPILGPILAIAGLVCRIIYWVKIAGYSGQLANRARDYDDEDDDRYDDDRNDDRDRDRYDDDRDDDRLRDRRRR
jgi:hypothetical protein